MDSIKAIPPKTEFPLIQVDLQNWDLDLMIELFLFDDLYKSDDMEFYERYIYNKRFLDSGGQILIAKDKVKIRNIWSKLGLIKRYKINFEPTKEKWDFGQVKIFLLSKVRQLSPQDGRDAWIEAIQKAKTIKQLIEAER